MALALVVEHHRRRAEPVCRLHGPAVRRRRIAARADEQHLRGAHVLHPVADEVGALGPAVAQQQLGEPVAAEDRRGLVVGGPQVLQVLGEPCRGGPVGVVRAVDRHQRGRQVVRRDVLGVDQPAVRPGPLARQADAARGEGQDAPGVAVLDQRGQRPLQRGPQLPAVQGLPDGAHQVLAGERAAEVRGHGVLVERAHQPDHLGPGLAPVLPERTAEIRRTPVQEVVQSRLLPLGPRHPLLGQRLGQRVHAVQDDPADLAGELRRVHRAEPAAVGEAEVVEVAVAERLADDVQVAGGVHGADVRQHRAGEPGALVGGLPQPLEQRLRTTDVGVLLRFGRGRVAALAAADGGGPADSARVEGDQVVALGQVHELLALGGQRGDAGAARAAEVQ